MKKAVMTVGALFLWCYVFSQTNRLDDSLTLVKTETDGKNGARHYGLEIPPGILFGKFEKENGPFLLQGSIIVPSGEILEFGPGCRIFVGGNYATITVFGQINLKGTAKDPIVIQSAQPMPHPWDWDRIYCRSRNRSAIEHCVIRHSNYGIFVENGSVSIEGCLFERNSLHGVVAKNSDVTINRSTFTKGQVLALFCMQGADVHAESLFVNGNITGIACSDKSRFEMQGGKISNNTNGLVVMRGSSVSIIAGDITKNKTGILTQRQIPRKMCEMAYSNTTDMKIESADELEQLLKAPESVKSIVLPQTASEISVKEDFKAGFAAIKAPREETGSFIGNVSAGFRYFAPHSRKVRDTFALQTRYPGEDAPGLADKIQPEVQVFASGKRGDANVDLLLDVYGNQYMGFRRNMTSLSLTYSHQALVLGDFYENFSETSINGRKLTGVKFDGNFLEMGKGVKRVAVQAAFGQSEMAKEVGKHELDLYNQEVDTGMSIRQQLTYVASIVYKPNFISTVGVKGIIARDQGYNTFIGGMVIQDPKAPGLVEAQTGCIDGKVDLLNGTLSLTAELDMGDHDTITDSTHPEELSKIAWYNPQIPEAISKVFGAIPKNKNYAASVGALGLLKGYHCSLTFTQIAPEYFSAGNPYLDLDRKSLCMSVDKEFSQRLSGNMAYEYQRRSIHGPSPMDNNSAIVNAQYGFGENLPEVALGYTFNYETSPNSQNVSVESIDTGGNSTFRTENMFYTFRDIKNVFSLEGKQQLKNNIDYSVRYQVLYENDFTNYIDTADMDKRDGLQHQVSAWLGVKLGKLLRNKIIGRYATQKRVQDSLNGRTYKVSDEVRLNIIPRKFSCTLKGEYGKRVDNKYNLEIGRKRDEITLIQGGEAELKYSFTSRLSLSIMDRYERNEDTETITDNYSVEIFGLHLTYLF